MTTRWWLCKYVPDLHRNEPRNIGVILFENGVFTARFLERPPSFVENVSNWKQWLKKWRHEIDNKRSPLYVRRAGDNYYVERCGELVEPKELLGLTLDALFERLVAKQGKRRA